ncbi:endonuclease V [Candidatus Fermentibacteria bacterium]|nr:endonuclease V [Candidatus Fermentibacteria bacterium]
MTCVAWDYRNTGRSPQGRAGIGGLHSEMEIGISNPAVRQRLARLQRRLAERVRIPSSDGYGPEPGDLLVCMDAQYSGNKAWVTADVHEHGRGHLCTYVCRSEVHLGYASGFLCFREGPLLAALLEGIREILPRQVALLVTDGHGIAHPRRMGLASWIGLTTGLPSVGCAKSPLFRSATTPDPARGSLVPLKADGRVVGSVVRTRTGVKPVYVSPGHLLSIASAAGIVLGLPGNYRLPDPLRRADMAARFAQRGEMAPWMEDLGELPPVLPESLQNLIP